MFVCVCVNGRMWAWMCSGHPNSAIRIILHSILVKYVHQAEKINWNLFCFTGIVEKCAHFRCTPFVYLHRHMWSCPAYKLTILSSFFMYTTVYNRTTVITRSERIFQWIHSTQGMIWMVCKKQGELKEIKRWIFHLLIIAKWRPQMRKKCEHFNNGRMEPNQILLIEKMSGSNECVCQGRRKKEKLYPLRVCRIKNERRNTECAKLASSFSIYLPFFKMRHKIRLKSV